MTGMHPFWKLPAATVLLLGFSCKMTPAAGLPDAMVGPAGPAPVIDASLGDACWSRPPDIAGFRQVGGSPPAPADEPTEVWLARNDAWLFIAARCHDKNAGTIACQCRERDGAIQNDESLEIFVSPGTDGKSYFHFKVNACGVQGENRFENGQRIEWDGHWRSAGRVDPAGRAWLVEIAVPLFYLAEAAGHAPWRMNVCRNYAGPKKADSWAQLSAFRYHAPEEFGTLAGLENVKAAPVFAPVIQASEIGNMVDLPERRYEVIASIKNDGALPGAVQASAADAASAGTQWLEPETVALPAGHAMTIRRWIGFADYEPRSTLVRISLSDNLGDWESIRNVSWARSQAPLAAAMDRSFYTTEKEYYLVYRSPLPEGFLAECRLKISGAWLKEDAVENRVRSAGRVRLPLDWPSNGTCRIKVMLERADGNCVKAVDCEAVKRGLAPAGNMVKIDRWRRCVLLNDQPFFPYGFYGAPTQSYGLMAGAFDANAALVWEAMSSTNLLAALDQAQSNGIFLVTSPAPSVTWSGRGHDQSAGRMHKMREQMLAQLPDLLDPVARHPALLAYHLFDEPFRTDLVRDTLLDIYQAVHDLDGYHPAFTGDFRWMEGDPVWAQLCDVGFPHSYWLPDGTENRVSRRNMARWREIQNAGRDLMKPVWLGMVNEFHSLTWRMMRPDERRVAAYLALIHEFTGLFYFAWPAVHESTRATISQLKRELDLLQPALLTRTPPQHFTVEGGDEDMVRALLKMHPDGGRVLLAANTLKMPVDVKFVIAGLADGAKIASMIAPGETAGVETSPPGPQDLTASRAGRATWRVKDGGWTDRLEAYGVRAYRIAELPEADGAPWEIRAVILNAGQVQQVLAGGQETNANLVLNPGFETDEGWQGTSAALDIGMDRQRAHSGSRSLRFRRDDAGAASAMAHSAPIELKPNTRYRCGAWVYGEITSGPEKWGGPSISIQSIVRPKEYRLNLQTHINQIQNRWQLRQGFLDVGPEGDAVQVRITAPRGKFAGSAWIDDVQLETVALRQPRNLLPNSGFEHAAAPGYPDRWFAMPAPQHLDLATMTPNSDALVLMDTHEKFEGEHSLRLRGYIWLNSAPTRNNAGVRLKSNTDYVFSIYMKADRADYEVRLRIPGAEARVQAGPDWRRYQLPVRTGAEDSRLHIQILPLGSMLYDGPAEAMPALWLDAAQFEEGAAPTAYVPDAYRLDHTAWQSLE